MSLGWVNVGKCWGNVYVEINRNVSEFPEIIGLVLSTLK